MGTTTVVGSYRRPDWLIDGDNVTSRLPLGVRARELWRIEERVLAPVIGAPRAEVLGPSMGRRLQGGGLWTRASAPDGRRKEETKGSSVSTVSTRMSFGWMSCSTEA
jgi:hypothetical protein